MPGERDEIFLADGRKCKKCLILRASYGKICTCDILFPCSFQEKGPETIRRCEKHEQI